MVRSHPPQLSIFFVRSVFILEFLFLIEKDGRAKLNAGGNTFFTCLRRLFCQSQKFRSVFIHRACLILLSRFDDLINDNIVDKARLIND